MSFPKLKSAPLKEQFAILGNMLIGFLSSREMTESVLLVCTVNN